MNGQAVQEVRCPHCSKLLFKAAIMAGQIEIQCPRCRKLVVCHVPAIYPTLLPVTAVRPLPFPREARVPRPSEVKGQA